MVCLQLQSWAHCAPFLASALAALCRPLVFYLVALILWAPPLTSWTSRSCRPLELIWVMDKKVCVQHQLHSLPGTVRGKSTCSGCLRVLGAGDFSAPSATHPGPSLLLCLARVCLQLQSWAHCAPFLASALAALCRPLVFYLVALILWAPPLTSWTSHSCRPLELIWVMDKKVCVQHQLHSLPGTVRGKSTYIYIYIFDGNLMVN